MVEEFSNDNNDSLKSKYNSALAQLYRLDNLWKDCHSHSRTNQFVRWNLDLDAIWRELSDWTKDEDDDCLRFKELNIKLQAAGLFEPTMENGFKGINVKELSLKSSKIYNLLMEKEIFLRRLQNKQGKSGAAEDDLDDYMNEGF